MSDHQGKPIDIPNFEPFLRKCLNSNQLQLIDLDARSMLPLGENYASVIVKIEARVRREKSADVEILHLVAKVPNYTERQLVIWPNVFDKELYMYTVLIPAYKEFEREFGVDAALDAFPKYFGHRCSLDESESIVDENSMLVMENLKTRGFYIGDRRVGVDLDHARMALSRLAKFHALGILLTQRRPEIIDEIIRQVNEPMCDFEPLNESFDLVLKTFRDNDNLNRKHMQVIESTFADAQNGTLWLRIGAKPWATIIHNDVWTTNMMFHRDKSGRVDNFKFVDFQTYLYNSPLKDLPVFLSGSVDEPTRRLNAEQLIDHYYAIFIETLVRLGCDVEPYGRREFDRELKRQAVAQFPLCALAFKFFVVEIKDGDKSSTIAEDIMKSQASPAVVELYRELVAFYEARGWF